MNKLLKIIAATSVLVLTASANAATVDYTISSTESNGAIGTGTGSLDTVSGIFTYSQDFVWDVDFGGGPTHVEWNFAGVIQTGVAPSGTITPTSCDETGTFVGICFSSTLNPLNVAQDHEGGGFFYDIGTFAELNPLVIDTTIGNSTTIGYHNATMTSLTEMTLTAVAPVPVPAAAWLFGSGLLGLVTVSRKRRA